MARPIRFQCAGLTYHVTARGVRKSEIYVDDVDRRRFLQTLETVVERYGLRCHAYCQMTNHYHLALTITDANLSRAMQHLNGVYAQWWNWRHQRAGHLFQARFKAQIVQDGRYLANVCRYIVLNPVRAGMVGAPDAWRWSSYRATVGRGRPVTFLDLDWLQDGRSPKDRVSAGERFAHFVQSADADTLRLSRQAVLGDDDFVARLYAYRDRPGQEIPRAWGRRSLSTIFEGAVTRTARDAAVLTAVSEHYTLAAIARYLQVHPTTVSKIVGEARGQTVKKAGVRP